MATKRSKQLRNLLTAITGHSYDDDQYIGKKVWGRQGSKAEKEAGEVTNTSVCTLSGCGGTRLHVKWSDGHRTYPCAKGCKVRPDGDLEIQ